ncbi:linker nucleoporin NUP82 Ecym_6290 [Eremothecium cymbalariae DBVPG|uniref:Nucleoporin Nup82 n=1 Tax=Eremothecium cymbalariae (strain CBS 270.75 / DBVPG 7215 / KCTC 17166 / NRRL Y-17582) TaxID=931890 RepID=G8JVJ1_ERECY|nr:hypothetical protein Ecym_6290 [Eremothecium cymbalariae DBVPG\
MTGDPHPIFQVPPFRTLSKLHVHVCKNATQIVTCFDKNLRYARVTEHTFKSKHLDIKHSEHSILNNSGTLIAFYGSNDVELFDMDGKKSCLRVELGIKQVLWHPLAYLDSCLVVLTKENTIELYELAKANFMYPTVVLNEKLPQLGISSHVSEICSMAFSPDGLTLYLLSLEEGGDVYALHPLLPSRLRIKRSFWESQWYKATALYESIDKDTPNEKKIAMIEHFDFVSKIYKMIDKDSEFFDVNIPEHKRMVTPRGPFSIYGFPEELYNTTATKLITLPVNDEGAYVLILSFDDGTILSLFPDIELLMSWSRSLNNACSFVLIEKFRAGGEIFAIESGVAILEKNNAHIVRFPYLKALGECIKEGDIAPMVDVKLTSDITPLAGSYHTVVTWNEPSTKGILFIGNSVIRSIPDDVGLSSFKPRVDPAISQNGKYTVCFPSTMEELLKTNKALQHTLRQPLPLVPLEQKNVPLNSEFNEHQLATLTKISTEVMDRIILAQSLGYLMYNRAATQQFELCRQLETVSKLNDRSVTLKQNTKSLTCRLDSVSKKDIALRSRLEKLQQSLDKVNESPKFNELPLSMKERAWFRELKNDVLAFNEYVLQNSKLCEELNFLKKELELIESNHGNIPNEELFNFEKLQDLLTLDSKMIGDCNDQLLAAAKDLENKLYI